MRLSALILLFSSVAGAAEGQKAPAGRPNIL